MLISELVIRPAEFVAGRGLTSPQGTCQGQESRPWTVELDVQQAFFTHVGNFSWFFFFILGVFTLATGCLSWLRAASLDTRGKGPLVDTKNYSELGTLRSTATPN